MDGGLRDDAPSLLLFDGIEAFLHPQWQRRVLPAVREALPETQSIVTSHSPFVISSCADATIHVLRVNKDGSAYAEAPLKAPIGESITSTLKDIFGVDSRFDVETEEQLNEWNELNKIRAEGKLEPANEARFKELTRVLSSRSEELRSIVNQPAALPKAVVDQLTETPRTGRVRRRVATH
jgi:predicted ATP-binding protein involved in virulence